MAVVGCGPRCCAADKRWSDTRIACMSRYQFSCMCSITWALAVLLLATGARSVTFSVHWPAALRSICACLRLGLNIKLLLKPLQACLGMHPGGTPVSLDHFVGAVMHPTVFFFTADSWHPLNMHAHRTIPSCCFSQVCGSGLNERDQIHSGPPLQLAREERTSRVF